MSEHERGNLRPSCSFSFVILSDQGKKIINFFQEGFEASEKGHIRLFGTTWRLRYIYED